MDADSSRGFGFRGIEMHLYRKNFTKAAIQFDRKEFRFDYPH